MESVFAVWLRKGRKPGEDDSVEEEPLDSAQEAVVHSLYRRCHFWQVHSVPHSEQLAFLLTVRVIFGTYSYLSVHR